MQTPNTQLKSDATSSCSTCCALNKLVVVVLMGAFLMLCLDIRWEHIDVARKEWIPWIPIVYSGAAVLLSIVGLALWSKGGRQLLLLVYLLAIVVGLLGMWFHNDGHPIDAITDVLSAWYSSGHHYDEPPKVAPLAFCGLGLLGVFATLKYFQPRSAGRGKDQG